MKLHTRWLVAGATAALGVLSACNADENLNVVNKDQPDVARALSTPDGIDAVLRGSFSAIFDATHGTSPSGSAASITPAAMVIGLESYGSVNNYSMNIRATIPRLPIDNNRGNNNAQDNFRDFQALSARARTTGNAIIALDKLTGNGGSLGSASQNMRARSFGFFSIGLANGELALVYDSAATASPALATSDIPGLQGYKSVMAVALSQLDTALAIANAAKAGGNSFSIPSSYMPITAGLTIDQYIALIRSVKARLRAGVARNPADRAAVDWNQVVADAAAGITSDVQFNLDANAGWSDWWLSTMAQYLGWHNMPNYIIGMADTSSGYANWLATDRSQRQSFLILTPDLRFPSGTTRTAQTTNSPAASAVLPTIYFRNRPPGEDTPGESWANSFYDHVRFRHYRQLGSTGPWIWFTRVENDMLRAEGLIRLNRANEAVPFINRTRVINGLEPFPGTATAASRAPAQPGGSATSCVPRTPTGAGNALECGTLMEAMKWEKRLETAMTGYVQWWIDSRGWGDLPLNSPLMWPVPYQEMDARVEPFYNSLTGAEWQAAASTYGFGTGNK